MSLIIVKFYFLNFIYPLFKNKIFFTISLWQADVTNAQNLSVFLYNENQHVIQKDGRMRVDSTQW